MPAAYSGRWREEPVSGGGMEELRIWRRVRGRLYRRGLGHGERGEEAGRRGGRCVSWRVSAK
jgi:hypothetical protein